MRKTALILAGAAMFDLGVIALADISAGAQDRNAPEKAEDAARSATQRGAHKDWINLRSPRRIDGSFSERDCNKAGGKVKSDKGEKLCVPGDKDKMKDKKKD